MYLETCDKPYVFGGEITHQYSAHRPVDDIHTTYIPTADGKVKPFLCTGCIETGQVIGVVTEVCIHLKDIVVRMCQCPFEPSDIGGTQSLFPTPFK